MPSDVTKDYNTARVIKNHRVTFKINVTIQGEIILFF